MNLIMKQFILQLTKHLPDKLYLHIMYFLKTRKRLRLDPPITFNEKLQWLKLNYRKNSFTGMVDKYEVRSYLSDIIDEKYLIPLLGVWDSIEDINIDSLPEKFVLKCTHDCNGISICTDKKNYNFYEAKRVLERALNRNFYFQGREWPYKNVRPRIIAEQYMTDLGEEQLTDYKVFNFDGEPFIIQVDFDRFNGHKRQFFDIKWNKLDISFYIPSDNSKNIQRPKCLEEMLQLSRKLSEGFPHLRTDFYIIGEKLYIGELTFFHGTGMGKWMPQSVDKLLGDKITLPEIIREDLQ